jgi:uncharacterized membrane protein YhaH (DUF805 family)
MQQSERRAKLGLALYSAGFSVALIFAFIATWGGLEAAMFDPSLSAERRLTSLRCPIIATPEEEVSVKATFTNPSDRNVRIPIRTRISHGQVTTMREVALTLPLDAGESQTLEWGVSADDLVFGRFILVRLFAVRSSPLPSRGGSCGIMILNIPYLTGNQFVALSLALSIVAMAIGGRMWLVNVRPLHDAARRMARILVLLAVIVMVTLLVAFFGYWEIGIPALIFTVLLLGTLLERFLARHGRG